VSRPLVLCYHGVSDRWQDPLGMPPRSLEAQVRWILRRRYRPATAEEVALGRGRTMHVTFDDAFRNVRGAVPMLRRMGVPMTVFACTAYAVDGRPLDVPELRLAVAAEPQEMRTLTFPELAELQAQGVEVGSHSCTHPHLTQLTDRELRREVWESRECVRDHLGAHCRFFAYPYGEHDERVRAAVAAAGYAAAFALPGDPRSGDRFQIPRVGLWRKDGLLAATLKTTALGKRLSVSRRWRRRSRLPRPAPPATSRSGDESRRLRP